MTEINQKSQEVATISVSLHNEFTELFKAFIPGFNTPWLATFVIPVVNTPSAACGRVVN